MSATAASVITFRPSGPRTALITGATSGIGATFARQLAAQGRSLVLVARDGARLAATRTELLELGAVKVEILIVDLTDPQDRDLVVRRLAAGGIDLLVNNAGLGLGKKFTEATAEELRYQIDLNITAVMELTHAALPAMLARRHGGVINVGSIAGLMPRPGASYGASKAWVVSFSEALSTDLAGTGVRVQALCPGFVRTEFHERAGIDMARTPGRLYVDIDFLVRTSLEHLDRNKVLSIPGKLYSGLAVFTRLLPRATLRKLSAKVG